MRTLLCGTALIVAAFAQTADPAKKAVIGNGTWWRNPDYAAQLKLTAKQIESMEKAHAEHQARLADLNSEFQKETVKFDSLMRAKTAPETELRAEVEKVAENRKQLIKQNMDVPIVQRGILDDEQWKKLLEIRERAKYESTSEASTPK